VAVAGGLAGLLYGFKQIPYAWIEQLSRKEDIEDLCERIAGVGDEKTARITILQPALPQIYNMLG
jgi:hypothetical protein